MAHVAKRHRRAGGTGGSAGANDSLLSETSLQSTPNRLRGLYGAAKAAEGAKEREKMATYFRKLAELTREADSDRVEIREANAFLAPR